MQPVDLSRIAQIETILSEWLEVPGITLFCGRWGDGATMELLPSSPPQLTEARYDGCFAGLRDLTISGQSHHIHLDLNQFRYAVYSIEPSVCFGFKPSFELRFSRRMRKNDDTWGFAVGLRAPYPGGMLDQRSVLGFFSRLAGHARRYPAVTRLRVAPGSTARIPAGLRREVEELFLSSIGPVAPALPDGDFDRRLMAIFETLRPESDTRCA